MNTTKKRFYVAGIIVMLIGVLAVGFALQKNSAEANSTIFKDVDFTVEADFRINYINDEKLKSGGTNFIDKIKVTDEDESTLLKELEKANFIPIDEEDYKRVIHDYFVDLTLTKRYEMRINSDYQYLSFRDDVDSATGHQYFKLANDSQFFTLIKELTEKALAEQ